MRTWILIKIFYTTRLKHVHTVPRNCQQITNKCHENSKHFHFCQYKLAHTSAHRFRLSPSTHLITARTAVGNPTSENANDFFLVNKPFVILPPPPSYTVAAHTSHILKYRASLALLTLAFISSYASSAHWRRRGSRAKRAAVRFFVSTL